MINVANVGCIKNFIFQYFSPLAGYTRLAKQQRTHFMAGWIHARELPTHILQFVLFSSAIVFKYFHTLPHEKIPLCFALLPLILRNNTKMNHEESVLRSNMRNLCICFASCIFSCYERILWPARKSSVTGFMINTTRYQVLLHRSWKARYSHFLKKGPAYPIFRFSLILIEKRLNFYMTFTAVW